MKKLQIWDLLSNHSASLSHALLRKRNALYADPDHLKGLGIVSPSPVGNNRISGPGQRIASHVEPRELLEDFCRDYGSVFHISSGGEVDARQRMSFKSCG